MPAIGSFTFLEKKAHWLTNLRRFRDTIGNIDPGKEKKLSVKSWAKVFNRTGLSTFRQTEEVRSNEALYPSQRWIQK